jgi:hypothetical protein
MVGRLFFVMSDLFSGLIENYQASQIADDSLIGNALTALSRPHTPYIFYAKHWKPELAENNKNA